MWSLPCEKNWNILRVSACASSLPITFMSHCQSTPRWRRPAQRRSGHGCVASRTNAHRAQMLLRASPAPAAVAALGGHHRLCSRPSSPSESLLAAALPAALPEGCDASPELSLVNPGGSWPKESNEQRPPNGRTNEQLAQQQFADAGSSRSRELLKRTRRAALPRTGAHRAQVLLRASLVQPALSLRRRTMQICVLLLRQPPQPFC